ncbi:MAG: hypothetical protein JW747_04370 [Candidatus Aminicenantes bacterium]|nr:hypothetical protein [Candidatus Aminicenantes bacterium]
MSVRKISPGRNARLDPVRRSEFLLSPAAGKSEPDLFGEIRAFRVDSKIGRPNETDLPERFLRTDR